MAPGIRVPEGLVFVPRRRDENVALELLNAAEKLKVDRFDVKTVSGGYHVPQAVADEYAKSHPEFQGEVEEDVEAAAAAAAAEAAAEERGYPDGEPTGDWTVKQLEAWAGAQDPVVELGSGDKASKLKAALDSKNPS